jgi:hypothetical protein
MNDGEGRLDEAVKGRTFEASILPYFTAPEPAAASGLRSYSFMRVRGVSQELECFTEIGGFSSEQRYPRKDWDWSEREGPVRNVPASPGWIPFASDCCGNFLCVDVDPDHDGSVGQVIEVAYDLSRLKVVASSLVDYLGTLVANMSSVSDGLDEAITSISRILREHDADR